MSASIWAALIWIVVANIAALIPSRDNHWTRAYILLATGAPLLVWLLIDGQRFVALAFVLAALSVLRWPFIYLWRWVKRRLGTGSKYE